MATAEFQGKDQNTQDESTIYWFTLHGSHEATGIEFNGMEYGLIDQHGVIRVVDMHGAPEANNHVELAVLSTARITANMVAA